MITISLILSSVCVISFIFSTIRHGRENDKINLQFLDLHCSIERLNKRISSLEDSTVRQTMEENPELVHKILDVQDRLIKSGLTPSLAFNEARRLYGIHSPRT